MSKWKPNLNDKLHGIPTGSLLKKAVWKLVIADKVKFPIDKLEDSYGCYCYVFNHFVVVAKEKPYGNIISVHRNAVFRAIERETYILMWLDSANKFYKIDPYEIKDEAINYKGTAAMINFDISMCKAIEI